ncbi:MAG: hypothetical protein HOW97_16620 [Catenulispora sp.]|nr:hypothetical protein [Catenulispora sp.]
MSERTVAAAGAHRRRHSARSSRRNVRDSGTSGLWDCAPAGPGGQRGPEATAADADADADVSGTSGLWDCAPAGPGGQRGPEADADADERRARMRSPGGPRAESPVPSGSCGAAARGAPRPTMALWPSAVTRPARRGA